MEIVLQWLDEIDDLVFVGLSIWHRVPYSGLTIALSAAVGLNSLSLLAIA
jgi:hypothetical protein